MTSPSFTSTGPKANFRDQEAWLCHAGQRTLLLEGQPIGSLVSSNMLLVMNHLSGLSRDCARMLSKPLFCPSSMQFAYIFTHPNEELGEDPFGTLPLHEAQGSCSPAFRMASGVHFFQCDLPRSNFPPFDRLFLFSSGGLSPLVRERHPALAGCNT